MAVPAVVYVVKYPGGYCGSWFTRIVDAQHYIKQLPIDMMNLRASELRIVEWRVRELTMADSGEPIE